MLQSLLTASPALAQSPTATQTVAALTLTRNHAASSVTPVTGSGGTAPLTYGVAPPLPTGLSYNTSTGAITGTPIVASSATTYTVTVTDANNATASNTFILTVNSAVTATQSVASATLTQNHAVTPFTPVTGAGGTTPFSYSISPSLPTGLSYNTSTGAITGTPIVTSSATTYTVTVTDANNTTASNTFILTVNTAVTATQSVASVTVTQNHAVTPFTPVTGAGGTTPLSYSISPSLPTGLSLNTATGAIFGTPTVASPSTGYTVTVTDANSATATSTFSLTVAGAVTATTVIPSTQLPVNQPANFTPVTGSGGTPPLTYAISPALPAGLSLNTSTGAIGGTPTVPATSQNFSVTVTDGNGSSATANISLTIGVIATKVAITSSQNPSSFGQPVTFTATVTGSGGTPSGNVSFSDGGTAIGTVALSAGAAAFTTSTLATGSHTITASYAGNSTFGPSASPALAQTVNIPADSVRLRALQVNVTKVVAQSSGQAISGAIDDAIADGFNPGGAFVTPGRSGVRFNFAADPADQDGEANAATASRLGPSAYPGLTPVSGVPSRGGQASSRINDAFAAIDQQIPKKAPLRRYQEKDWLFWVDVRGSGVDRWGTSTVPGLAVTESPLHGTQLNALMGLTYRMRPNFLIGVLGGYETFNYVEQDINGKLTGGGWTVGSYLGWRITPTLRYDAAVTYSGIGYDGTSGTAQGSFGGQRWLMSMGVTGDYKAAGFLIEPSARVYALWEAENAYVDSLGTQQASRDFSTGRASSGIKASYPLRWSDDVLLVPYLGAYADDYFTEDNATVAAAGGLPLASTPLLDGWSARVTGGLGAQLAGGAILGLGGQYGGIGSNTRVWTATAKAQVPF